MTHACLDAVDLLEQLGLRYLQAKGFVTSSGYQREIEWQESRDFNDYTESELLREAAWVILCSGFRERTVAEKFDYISLCFFDFEAAYLIARDSVRCIESAMPAIGHSGKLNAIVQICEEVADRGFFEVKREIDKNPQRRLGEFPFLGAVTSLHLAKNLGYQVCKPDRHLVRIARCAGYTSVSSLCCALAQETGDSIGVVDLVLWRAATLLPEFPVWFSRDLNSKDVYAR